MKNKNRQYGSVFELNGIPRFSQLLPLSLQHLVAMIVGCVTPALIVSGVAGLNQSDRVILVQASLVIAAISTIVQVFPIAGKLGSGLPMIIGVSFAYLPTLQAIAGSYDIATILGAQLIGGICAVIVGVFVKKLRILFPPLITGTVVFTIGLSLYPTAVNYMAGGTGNPSYGSWKNWLVAIFTLVVVTVLNHFSRGIFKIASILFGIIAGYIAALCLGMIDFSSVKTAGLFHLPGVMHFGINFEFSSIVAMSILFIINSVQAIGDFTATTTGGMDREPTDKELQGGIMAYGLTNILGSFLGGLSTATYSQNVGIVATTKVVNRMVFGLAALLMLLAGLIPKFSALLTTIPQCVLGGATISVFASIAMTGLKLIFQEPLSYRSSSIVGLSVALGMGLTQVSESLAQFPEWVTTIFGKSPVVLAALAAILLNQLLPHKNAEMASE